jgi:hypothetical protein
VLTGVKATGLRETYLVFQKLQRSVAGEIRDEFIKIAEPVAESARERLSRYRGASVTTIRPRASSRGAFVTQVARKVTGRRPDFGALQMVKVMIPALEEHEDEIVSRADEALYRLTRANGF